MKFSSEDSDGLATSGAGLRPLDNGLDRAVAEHHGRKVVAHLCETRERVSKEQGPPEGEKRELSPTPISARQEQDQQ